MASRASATAWSRIAARICACSCWNRSSWLAFGRRRRAAPDRAPRDDETAEIFEEAAELRIAGGIGDLAVKGEVLIDRVIAAVDGRLDCRKTVGDLLDLRRRGALGGKPGGLDLDAGAQFHDVEHLAQRRTLVEIDPERPPHVIGDKGADALAGHHQPVGLERGNRLAHHGAADAGGGDHFLLGRQPRAGQQLAADDIGGEPGDEFAGQARAGPRAGATGQDFLANACSTA